ncbi:MAG: hypothetical protein LKI24_02880 [Acidipropionibacterium sp.]|jgi:hypothetical protein|nr:hypothetical protein [Acidipropionibacterium sp.]
MSPTRTRRPVSSRREVSSPGPGTRRICPPRRTRKLVWVLAWGMGIIGAIIIIVWAGMILFVN